MNKLLKNVYWLMEVSASSADSFVRSQYLADVIMNFGAAAIRVELVDHKSNIDLAEYDYRKIYGPTHPMIRPRMNWDDQVRLRRYCATLALPFIGSPWDLNSLSSAKELKCDALYINGLNFDNYPLVEEALKSSLPCYLSTAGWTEEECLAMLKRYSLRDSTTILHGTSCYPPPEDSKCLGALHSLSEQGFRTGYSANDSDIATLLAASANGASVLAIHVHAEPKSQYAHAGSWDLNKLIEARPLIERVRRISGNKKIVTRGEMLIQAQMGKSPYALEKIAARTRPAVELVQERMPPLGIKGSTAQDFFLNDAKRNINPGFVREEPRKHQRETSLPLRIKEARKRGVPCVLNDFLQVLKEYPYDYAEMHLPCDPVRVKNYKFDAVRKVDLYVHAPISHQGVLLDLSSHDEELRKFSVKSTQAALQNVMEVREFFQNSQEDIPVVLHAGTMTFHPRIHEKKAYEDRFKKSIFELDLTGIRPLIENMTPYAWNVLRGDWRPLRGQSNAFLAADDLVQFSDSMNLEICLDLCHAQLYCNVANESIIEYVKVICERVTHVHFSDARGFDGEGYQVGEGDLPWIQILMLLSDRVRSWTPEIFNGHLGGGSEFAEAHRRLNALSMEVLK